MNTKPPNVEVLVTFLPTEHGGKLRGVRSGYRPQFYYDNYDWVADFAFADGAALLGTATRALVTFMNPHEHLGKLSAGAPFLVREGQKVVGYGAVTRIIDVGR